MFITNLIKGVLIGSIFFISAAYKNKLIMVFILAINEKQPRQALLKGMAMPAVGKDIGRQVKLSCGRIFAW
ncbi:MAG: hypothetical protein ACFB0G_11865 [Leptolyngbyaceae cyanobacterium]